MAIPPLKIFSDFSQLKEQIDFQRFVSAWAKQVHSVINETLIPQINSNSTMSAATNSVVIKTDSCGNYPVGTPAANIPNFTHAITPVSNRVRISIQPDATNSPSYLELTMGPTVNAQFTLLIERNAVQIARLDFVNTVPSSQVTYFPSISYMDDTVTAGTNYTYTIAAGVTGAGASGNILFCVMVLEG